MIYSNPPLEFKPLYHSESLYLFNPYGDVSITTLWSRPAQVIKWLEQQGIDLAPQTSRVAVIANLYGNGLPQMLRNLLYNPQRFCDRHFSYIVLNYSI